VSTKPALQNATSVSRRRKTDDGCLSSITCLCTVLFVMCLACSLPALSGARGGSCFGLPHAIEALPSSARSLLKEEKSDQTIKSINVAGGSADAEGLLVFLSPPLFSQAACVADGRCAAITGTVFFRLNVTTAFNQWTTQKRYSQFEEFHNNVLIEMNGKGGRVPAWARCCSCSRRIVRSSLQHCLRAPNCRPRRSSCSLRTRRPSSSRCSGCCCLFAGQCAEP
jgi:hypothetical protein